MTTYANCDRCGDRFYNHGKCEELSDQGGLDSNTIWFAAGQPDGTADALSLEGFENAFPGSERYLCARCLMADIDAKNPGFSWPEKWE